MRGQHAFEVRTIPDLYRWFASEAAPTSPIWQRLCLWIAEQPDLVALLDALPGAKRQPNVFLGALKYLDGPLDPGPATARWVLAHWPELRVVIMARATQTNEPGRCAVLAPVLASLPQPITLLEVGSSAGLCLIPDRYRYRHVHADGPDAAMAAVVGGDPDAPAVSSDGVELACAVDGHAPGDPADLRIAARLGLDAHPLSAADPDDVRWLRALVWPGEGAREARLAAALTLAAQDPPPILRGDLRSALPALLDAVAPGSTPVIQHSAVLSYLPRADRDAFAAAIREAGVRWLSYEGPSVVTSVRDRLTDRDAWADRPHFVVALDGDPIARASAHGGWVSWFPAEDR